MSKEKEGKQWKLDIESRLLIGGKIKRDQERRATELKRVETFAKKYADHPDSVFTQVRDTNLSEEESSYLNGYYERLKNATSFEEIERLFYLIFPIEQKELGLSEQKRAINLEAMRAYQHWAESGKDGPAPSLYDVLPEFAKRLERIYT